MLRKQYLNQLTKFELKLKKQRARVSVWLYEQSNSRIEGCIVGFDEYMNLVLDNCEEIHLKTKNRKALGKLLCFIKVLVTRMLKL